MSNQYMNPSYEPELLEGKRQMKKKNLKGVYRLKSGKEIQCDSKAEARFAQCMEDAGMAYHRVSTKEKAPVEVVTVHRRYPDFKIPTDKGLVLLEIKGQLQAAQRKKMMETGKQAMKNGFLYCVKLAGRKDRLTPSTGLYLPNTDRKSRASDRNLNQRNLRIFKEQCRQAKIPIICTLEDIKESFNCEFIGWDEFNKLYPQTDSQP